MQEGTVPLLLPPPTIQNFPLSINGKNLVCVGQLHSCCTQLRCPAGLHQRHPTSRTFAYSHSTSGYLKDRHEIAKKSTRNVSRHAKEAAAAFRKLISASYSEKEGAFESITKECRDATFCTAFAARIVNDEQSWLTVMQNLFSENPACEAGIELLHTLSFVPDKRLQHGADPLQAVGGACAAERQGSPRRCDAAGVHW